MSSSNGFDSTPYALSSINKNYEVQFSYIQVNGGYFVPNDIILLASDTFSAWCLSKIEAGKSPVEHILSIETDKIYSEFISSLRRDREIKNDDTSLLIIRT